MNIRDHDIYRIEYKYRQQIRESDGGGESNFVAWATELTSDEWIGVFPSKAIAKAYAKRRLEHIKDAEIIAVVYLYKLDALIIEHQY